MVKLVGMIQRRTGIDCLSQSYFPNYKATRAVPSSVCFPCHVTTILVDGCMDSKIDVDLPSRDAQAIPLNCKEEQIIQEIAIDSAVTQIGSESNRVRLFT